MIAGIVCEYNPFHNGHLYHIKKTRESGADYVVCVMSGNFVQRGECACTDKWLRAKAAVLGGADVVIDLPTPWSCASAETFARGSVGLLMNFGIDMLSFGCETDSKELLMKCAGATDNEEVSSFVKRETAKGLSYPSAVQRAVEEIFGSEYAKALSQANNTLATEYIKQLIKYGRENDILPVRREGVSHDSRETKGNIASASMIRNMGLEGGSDYMPADIAELFGGEREKGYAPACLAYSERSILACLRSMKKEDFSLYVSDETGLAPRIFEAAKRSESLNELYEKAKSKNYTMSRVRREVMSLYLGVNKQWSEGIPPYMKILAVSQRGLTLLSRAKENSSLPIVTKHSEAERLTGKAKEIYDAECRNTDLFMLMSKKIRECGLEKTHSLWVAK